MKCQVACVQLTIGDNLDDNLRNIDTHIHAAAKAGAEFITLPENVALMLEDGKKLLEQSNHHLKKTVLKAIKKLAAELGCWILAGSIPFVSERTPCKLLNRSFLISDKGRLVAYYDKIHLCDIMLPNGQSLRESERYKPGSRLGLADTPWGKLGLTICYDMRFPQLYRELAQRGAEIIAVPSAFTKITGEAHWHVLLRARAIENGCYIIAPAQVGTHPGNRHTYGHSLIIDPWGKVLADGGEAEGYIMAEIDTDKVKEIRGRIPSLQHDRSFEI